MGKIYNFLFLVLMSIVLTGCGDMRSAVSNAEVLSSGMTAPADYYNPGNVYCYNTLGSVECYSKPLKGQAERLVSKYEHNPKIIKKREEVGLLDHTVNKPKKDERAGLFADLFGKAKHRINKKRLAKLKKK